MENETTETTLNKQPVTQDQLEEAQKALSKNERIVEVTPGDFRKLQRLQE